MCFAKRHLDRFYFPLAKKSKKKHIFFLIRTKSFYPLRLVTESCRRKLKGTKIVLEKVAKSGMLLIQSITDDRLKGESTDFRKADTISF